MSRRDPPPPADVSSAPAELPPHDVPSPDVLDELLRAFAADAVDTTTLRAVDLDSPEVEELLAPTAPTPAPEHSHEQEQPQAQVEVEAESEPEAEPEAHEAPGDQDVGDQDVGDQDVGDQDVGDQDVGDQDVGDQDVGEPDVGEPDVADPSGAASRPTGTVRTIRIDASDDPPDAVYLAAGDPLLAPGATAGAEPPAAVAGGPPEGTVFIDDQDVGLGETISIADASAATRMEPRLRERRIAVKRAAGRKRLRWALIALGVVVVVVAVLAVLGSSLFAVHTVDVEGAVYTDKAALQRVVDELDGTPVLRVDTSKAERQLEAIPWVEAARVTTDFPNRATIELRERTPSATYQGSDGRFRVLDGDGRVLDVLDAQPTDYLLLVGADAPDLKAGQFAPQGYVAAARMARALTPEMRAVAESATVTADGSDLRLLLQGDVEVRFGPARDLVTKLVRLQTKLDEIVGGGFQYVDVSTNEVTMG